MTASKQIWLSGKRSKALKSYISLINLSVNVRLGGHQSALWLPHSSFVSILIFLYVFTILILRAFSLTRFDLQWCSRCAAWFCSPSSSLRRSLWGCTTSSTGATAWPGDLPSSLLEELSFTASTPRTMKTTTKIPKNRWEIKTMFHPVCSQYYIMYAQPQTKKIGLKKNTC